MVSAKGLGSAVEQECPGTAQLRTGGEFKRLGREVGTRGDVDSAAAAAIPFQAERPALDLHRAAVHERHGNQRGTGSRALAPSAGIVNAGCRGAHIRIVAGGKRAVGLDVKKAGGSILNSAGATGGGGIQIDGATHPGDRAPVLQHPRAIQPLAAPAAQGGDAARGKDSPGISGHDT